MSGEWGRAARHSSLVPKLQLGNARMASSASRAAKRRFAERASRAQTGKREEEILRRRRARMRRTIAREIWPNPFKLYIEITVGGVKGPIRENNSPGKCNELAYAFGTGTCSLYVLGGWAIRIPFGCTP